MSVEEAWTELTARTTELKALEGLMGVVEWDQQVMMPAAGAGARGQQMALLSGLHHQKMTDPRIGELLDGLSSGALNETQSASVRNLRRDHERATKVPTELVRRAAVARAAAFPAWAQAKNDDDWKSFEPHLATLLELAKETVDAVREDQADPYDVLLEPFDPGSTVAELDPMFERLSSELQTFLAAVGEKEGPAPLVGQWDVAAQNRMHLDIAGQLGFDFQRGRLDDSEHPFTVGIAPGDVRITTHIYPDGLLRGLSGTIHEVGHGLYEQGLPAELHSLPCGGAASFGLHESQSRFWENTIGRSRAFCGWLSAQVKSHLNDDIDPDALYRASNRVQPSLIRIFADEATYNLHIVVRYQLERALFNGELTVAELPGAWSDTYEKVLGVRPANDAEGVLQDVHWAGSMFAYFPSYTLGNLYAASLGAQMQEDIPELWEHVARGEFAPVLSWLRENIHSRAHLADAPDILAAKLGERDHVEDLVAYLWGRHGQVYGVER